MPKKDDTPMDAQSTGAFGGQIRYVVCPRKIIADSEAQKFESLNFFKKVFRMETDWRVRQMVIPKRQSECEICED